MILHHFKFRAWVFAETAVIEYHKNALVSANPELQPSPLSASIMYNQPIIIDASNFSSLEGFYDEIEKKLTKDLDWSIGRNLDAFNDVLRGGFGCFDYEEPFILVWANSDKSRQDLGWPETINYVEGKLSRCHPSNINNVKADLELARQHKGKTLFEILGDIISSHDHIDLRLE